MNLNENGSKYLQTFIEMVFLLSFFFEFVSCDILYKTYCIYRSKSVHLWNISCLQTSMTISQSVAHKLKQVNNNIPLFPDGSFKDEWILQIYQNIFQHFHWTIFIISGSSNKQTLTGYVCSYRQKRELGKANLKCKLRTLSTLMNTRKILVKFYLQMHLYQGWAIRGVLWCNTNTRVMVLV